MKKILIVVIAMFFLGSINAEAGNITLSKEDLEMKIAVLDKDLLTTQEQAKELDTAYLQRSEQLKAQAQRMIGAKIAYTNILEELNKAEVTLEELPVEETTKEIDKL